MTWTIYLLSVMDGFYGTANFIACISGLAWPALMVGAVVFQNEEKILATVRAARRVAGIVFCVSAAACTVVPTQERLVQAWLMAEGSKVVSADSTKTVALEARDQLRALVKALSNKDQP